MVNQAIRWYLCFAVVLVAMSVSYGQEVGTIRGRVTDADFDDAPVPEVTVRIAETEQQVTTGEQGNYAFPGVEPGTYTLVFSKANYTRSVESNVVVSAGQLTDVDVSLTGDFAELEEFVVRELQLAAGSEAALLDLRLESPALLDSIGSDFLSRAGAGDAAEGLRLVSGATTTEGGFAAVRGLPPRYVNTQLNATVLPSADPDTRAVQLDLFPSEVIESIQVSKTFTPDQQGNASGGAVNIVTKSIPDQNFLRFSSKVQANTQRPGSDGFLADARGPVNYLGIDSRRDLADPLKGLTIAPPELPIDAFGGVGPTFEDTPMEYEWNLAGGGVHEFDNGVKFGGLATFFWDQGISHHENGVDEQYVLSTDPDLRKFGLIPEVTGNDAQGFAQNVSDGPDQVLTSLFDETQSEQEITWGALGSVGVESENNRFKFTFFHTRVTSSTATIFEDTRGKELKFPGHMPSDVATPGGEDNTLATGAFGEPLQPGGDLRNFAPFRRLETQEYVERSVQTIQFDGEHRLPILRDGLGEEGWLEMFSPVLNWRVSRSKSRREMPGFTTIDSKFFSATSGSFFINPNEGSQRQVTFPGSPRLGALNVVFQDIEESSTEYDLSATLPFENWAEDAEGSLKVGLFNNETERDFQQDTFTGLQATGNNIVVVGDFGDSRFSRAVSDPDGFDGEFRVNRLTSVVADDPGTLEPAPTDFNYTGDQSLDAWYWMLDLPITSRVKVIGGIRYESTRIATTIEPDTPATSVLLDGQVRADLGLPVGGSTDVNSIPGGVEVLNVDLEQEDILPSIGVVIEPLEGLTLRAAYSETIARPTFRELTPVSQVLFGGETPFVGNPFIELSSVDNIDFRVDYRPFQESLFSISYFRKDIDDVIQVVQQAQASSELIIPVNFPSGEVRGWEFEARQGLGRLDERLRGLTIGGNATLLDTQVTLRDFESGQLAAVGAPQSTVAMTNAPDFLYNLFLTYDAQASGTQLSLFWTFRGDTLIATPGVANETADGGQFFVPGIVEKEFGTLNFTLTQQLGKYFSLKFSAENLTNPKRQTVFRSDFVPGGDVVKTSFTQGIDLSVSLGGSFEF